MLEIPLSREFFVKAQPAGLLVDWQIAKLCPAESLLDEHNRKISPMISPCVPGDPRPGIVSYGLSSAGYDVRLGRKFKIFTNVFSGVVDPKRLDPNVFVDFEGDVVEVPPNSFALGETIEVFDIPRELLVVCLGKSTYARCGIIVNVTPLEPEWRGRLTIEISNTTPLPARVYANEGIAQLLFFRTSEPCNKSYADKRGKYQDQKGLTLPVVPK